MLDAKRLTALQNHAQAVRRGIVAMVHRQEGQIWEAAMFARKYALDHRIAFTDRNRLQTDGNTEDVMPGGITTGGDGASHQACEDIKDTFGEFGTAAELLDHYGLRARDIVREALAVLAARETAGVNV